MKGGDWVICTLSDRYISSARVRIERIDNSAHYQYYVGHPVYGTLPLKRGEFVLCTRLAELLIPVHRL